MPREIDCPDCGGDGHRLYSPLDPMCQDCEGSGKITVYTEAEMIEAVQAEREAFKEMINYRIIMPEVPKKLLLEAIRQRGEK